MIPTITNGDYELRPSTEADVDFIIECYRTLPDERLDKSDEALTETVRNRLYTSGFERPLKDSTSYHDVNVHWHGDTRIGIDSYSVHGKIIVCKNHVTAESHQRKGYYKIFAEMGAWNAFVCLEADETRHWIVTPHPAMVKRQELMKTITTIPEEFTPNRFEEDFEEIVGFEKFEDYIERVPDWLNKFEIKE